MRDRLCGGSSELPNITPLTLKCTEFRSASTDYSHIRMPIATRCEAFLENGEWLASTYSGFSEIHLVDRYILLGGHFAHDVRWILDPLDKHPFGACLKWSMKY